jgi:hypothetical protein
MAKKYQTLLPLLYKLRDELDSEIANHKDSKKIKINEELKLELHVKVALDIYKETPELFNSYPDESYYPNDALKMMEYFCLCVDKKKKLPPEMLEYFRDSFKKILKGGQSVERCLNIVGRKQKNPYLPPDYLEDITSDILDKGCTLIKACKEAHLRGVTKDDKTIMQNFNEFRQYLLMDWMVGKEINLKRKLSTTDLTLQQIQAINKYFKITFPTK